MTNKARSKAYNEFSPFGDIYDISILNDKFRDGGAFGFITYFDKRDAARAIETMNGVRIDKGIPLRITWSKKYRDGSYLDRGSGSQLAHVKYLSDRDRRTLKISGLNTDLSMLMADVVKGWFTFFFPVTTNLNSKKINY